MSLKQSSKIGKGVARGFIPIRAISTPTMPGGLRPLGAGDESDPPCFGGSEMQGKTGEKELADRG
jgi:hypothetical protein